jgi:carbon storage regulator
VGVHQRPEPEEDLPKENAMLVLSRKIGERIVMPNCELTVTVLAVEGKKVRLGITAPADLDVYREEVWQQISERQQSRVAVQ